MIDGDLDSSEAVTLSRFAVPQDDGTTIINHVLESLDPSAAHLSTASVQLEISQPNDDYNYDHNMSPPPSPRPKKCRVRIIPDFEI